MKNSPWGEVQHALVVMPQVYFVSTASHGGIMLTEKRAKKVLSPAAIKRGRKWGNYLCYEEDCDMDMIVYEHPEAIRVINPEITETFIEIKISAYRSLSRWYPEYLQEVGVFPSEREFKQYLFYQEDAKMRKEKAKNLIVSAIKGIEETTVVTTADEKRYLVRGYKYPRPEGEHNLLDYCEVVREMANQ